MSTIAVLCLSDAFFEVWDALAAECGSTIQYVSTPEDLPGRDSLGIVAAGGEEVQIADVLRRVSPGASRLAAVGSLASHRLAVAVVRAGATDYFALPQDYELLRAWLYECAQLHVSGAQRRAFAAGQSARYSFEGIHGDSTALRRALDVAERVIPHPKVTVLLTGETGTGKELLARAIHYNGPRREAPFVDINCAAIPEQLLESELFGHEKGAFTSAIAIKPGLFEVAQGGTIFLDEIGHCTLALQGKLLRVLEERTMRRVGGQRLIEVDVRVIAATHVNLERAVKAGQFRADLFHRLNVVPVELPPLRQRTGDVIALARLFLNKHATEYSLLAPALSQDAEQYLTRYAWPGNVRELRNAMERALLLATRDTLEPHDFAFLKPSVEPAASASGQLPFPGALEDLVRAAVTEMIALCDGNKSEAARRLGISRPRLTRLVSVHPPNEADLGDFHA